VDGEIVARVERRRHWTPREKAALLAEIDAAGGQVSTVARRHGIARSLLYNWRAARKAALETPLAPGFIQLGVVTDSAFSDSARRAEIAAASTRGTGFAAAERSGVMEIDLPDGVRVRVDGGVDEQALRRVLSAVRGLR
jgi:transposase